MLSSKYEGEKVNGSPAFPLMSRLVKLKKQVVVGCATIFVFATALALYQPVNPHNQLNPQGWERFIYPKETNPQLKLAGVGAELRGITNIAEKVWVVGEQGTILYSEDGGNCWRPQGPWIGSTDETSPSGEQRAMQKAESNQSACSSTLTGAQRLFSIFPSFSREIASNLSPFPKAHASGEKSKIDKTNKNNVYKEQTKKDSDIYQTNERPAQSSIEQITVTGSKRPTREIDPLVVPFENKFIAKNGQSYNQVPVFNSVSFANSDFGVSVGESGVITTTNNGGKDWSSAKQYTEFDLYSVTSFYDESNQQNSIVAVGQNGVILVSRTSGQEWQIFQTADEQDLLSVSVNQNGNIVAVGESELIFQSENNGVRWLKTDLSSPKGFDSVYITGSRQIYAAGADGVIKRTFLGNNEWEDIAANSDSQVQSIIAQFEILAAVNENNELLISKDQGKSWQVYESLLEQQLLSVRLTETKRAITLSEQGIIQAFDMVESRWQQLTTNNVAQTGQRYIVSVAPWWYLVTFICAGLILTVIWPRDEGPSPEEGIAGMAASDRPLQPGDPDALNLGKIAADVTSFLSNPKTTAPLTLAITGPWGCGKSSLMNLIRAELKERGFLPVWFNAWHHQKGEQLLASLFAHITQQAIPPWFSFDGVIFRARLVAIRGRRHWFIFALMMFLLFMTWAINDGNTALVSNLQGINWSEFWAGLFGNSSTVNQTNQGNTSVGIIPMVASLFGIAAPLIALLKSVKGFGISPEKLVSVDHRNKDQKGYDPGARARFADEFADVTTALGSNKMVIFIDDLDRCSQENLIDILENINFISSSGDCYLLLGMAPKYIEACVANAYETLAQNIAEKERFEESKLSARDQIATVSNKERHKFSFAHQYLEKMINIEIAIPSMTENSIERLLHQSEQSEDSLDERTFLQRLFASMKPLFSQLNRAMPLIFIVVAIKAGWDYGKSVPAKPAPPPPSLVNLGTIDSESLANLISSHPELDIDTSSLPQRDFKLALEADQKLVTKGLKVASLGSGKDKLNLILSLSDLNQPISSKNAGRTRVGQSDNSRADPSQATTSESAQDSNRRSDKAPAGDSNLLNTPENEREKTIPFRAESRDTSPRLSGAVLLLFILLFSSFSLYIFKRQKQKFSKDSDDFREALNRWTQWIQIKQETPRAIKRFLNHLRYQSIRNRKVISESLLVAYASIAFFEKNWILNDKKFSMICDGQLSELLALEFQSNQDQKSISKRWEKLAERMSESLDGVDRQELRDNRQHALSILQSSPLDEISKAG